uniref:Spondin-1 n=1 Tax=Stomoxys calcitrans TaxID=35570 RepID=A0A1I8PDY0_STOCA
MSPFRLTFGFVSLLALVHHCSTACYRIPQAANGDRSPVDENYQILIDGNPSTYHPGRVYNISLACPETLKFMSFTLLVEAENPEMNSRSELLGKFEIINSAETKFSNLCENMIESSNTNLKHRISVSWVAPDHGDSDCVLFKAAVLQQRTVWFMDDGYLTKKLCREHVDEIQSQLPPVDPCCACDEAKYEIVLERNWTRNTHPKDFPFEAWRTSFGTMIGASHSVDYTFWSYGSAASQGLRELAEHGSSSSLEMEIKNHTESGSIRTIIKAPGIKYRSNFQGKTLATVRVGPKHHMISLVSKINPSPDWILGVASMELCTENCRWIEGKVLNLYPWDVGTDSGASYMSPDQPQIPPDVVRRITSSFPSDDHSPFYDKTGAPMKPLGTLRVTRKRTYGRCFDEDSQNELPLECDTHPWTEWSECNVKCGPGTQYRLRDYKDPEVAKKKNCQEPLRQNQECNGPCSDTVAAIAPPFVPSFVPSLGPQPTTRYGGAECELSQWSAFSECSNRCGAGVKTKTRNYVNPYNREKCQSAGLPYELTHTEPCEGTYCGGNIPGSPYGRRTNDRNMYGGTSSDYDEDQNRYNPSGNVGTEDEDYDGLMGSIDESDMRSQIARPTAARYDDFGRNIYESPTHIYGSERLRGGPPGDGSQFVAGDLEANYNENSGKRKMKINPQSTRNPNRYTTKPSLRQNPTPRNSLRGFSRTTPRGFPEPYKFSPFENSNPFNIRTIEDDTLNMAGEKSFCLERPSPSYEPCTKPRVFLKNYWFYDALDMQCKLFTSDNCDENRNKFLRLEECEEQCEGVNQQGGADFNNPEGFNDGVRPDLANAGAYGNRGSYDAGGSLTSQKRFGKQNNRY